MILVIGWFFLMMLFLDINYFKSLYLIMFLLMLGNIKLIVMVGFLVVKCVFNGFVDFSCVWYIFFFVC